MQRAETETPVNGLNRKFYSAKQLGGLLETRDEDLKKYRLKGIEINRNAQRLLGKLNDHKQLMLSLAECDEVAVARIVRVALRQGCGAAAIVDRLGKAQEGLYHCQDYSDEISANLKSICGPARATTPHNRGFSILIDEIALEERLRYSVAEDAVLGICREHAGVFNTWNMTGRPISHLYDLKQLLDSGKCHRAKEATTVAIAPFSEFNYTPMIVLVSGTCKTETVEQQRSLISLVIHTWNESPHGRSALGSLWSIATDGDARRRQAIHRICMSQALSPTSPLYAELQHLDLLNLMCGDGEVTHDGDFKHEEKRLAAALRSGNGVFVNGMHLSSAVIKQYLRYLPDMTTGRLDSLFYNTDRQNVPRAHALLKAIYDAAQLPDIRSQTANQPFVLLAEFLHAFYAPHTTPSMSLSQQVASIAECAFLLFAIFRVDWTRFISTQLYYDIQASIKNAVFCIAKTKLLDPTQCFYLLQLGDDRLENQFGIYRTMTSDCNPDILQLAERSGAVQEVVDVFGRHPESDRKPYRISLEGASGIDHLNPGGWVGNVCVGDVNLQSSWTEGRDAAEQVLRRAGIAPNFNPDVLRALFPGRDIDLMRPHGHYVGVTELDLSTDNLSPSILLSALDDLAPSSVGAGATHSVLDPTCSNLSSVPELDHAVGYQEGAPGITVTPLAEDFTDAELPLEHLLHPCMPAPEDDLVSIPEGSTHLKRGWVNIESRWVHLESATRLILGVESSEKSTDRLRRVCGFSRYPSMDTQSDSILGDLCLIGQLVLALVRVDQEVALAVARVTSIRTGKSKVESISMDHLNRPDVVMSGQILALDFQGGIWYWNRSYVGLVAQQGKQNTNDMSDTKPLLVDFPARIIEPVNPSLSGYDGHLVWSFQQPELAAAMDLLWSKSSENRHNLPVCRSSLEFPYKLGSKPVAGNRLIHYAASEAIEALPAEQCGPCYLCGQMVPIKHHMRTHVAKHILAKRLKYQDPLLNATVSHAPCGFCGRSGTCKTTLAVKKTSTSLKLSDCPFYDKFSYKPAAKTTIGGPCTNRPILCEWPVCAGRDPIWSYNMLDHVLAIHGRAAYDNAVNTGLFQVSAEEIKHLKLDNMFIIPGRSPITLRPAPTVGNKRPNEDSTSIEGPALSQNVPDLPTPAVASGSGSKRVRFE
ncbi:hypothetical protein FRC10_010673 [Ceratobasidium sp. 414]|nr:hypothetical protein FRC10_010673 [Ceratobasidium sp. 414]